MSAELLSFIVSALALLISAATAWLTLFRRGSVRMTQPTTIFFGPDGYRGPAKVFLRTLLYSTAERGHIIENMFLRLRRRDEVQSFNIWIHGDTALARGSGLYVGRSGVSCNHHFVLPRDSSSYSFGAGEYILEVFASVLGRKGSLLLSRQTLHLTEEQARAMGQVDAGVFFDWAPDEERYYSHMDRNRTAELNALLSRQVRLPDNAVEFLASRPNQSAAGDRGPAIPPPQD